MERSGCRWARAVMCALWPAGDELRSKVGLLEDTISCCRVARCPEWQHPCPNAWGLAG